jgi:uncharacterized membrane protein
MRLTLSSLTLALVAPAAAQQFIGLGHLPDGVRSIPYGVSEDGTIVVGSAYVLEGAPLSRAFRWTAQGGMESLGLLEETSESHAIGISSGGDVIAGYCGYPAAAFRWTASGMHALKPALESTGTYAAAVSDDGLTIAGFIEREHREHAAVWIDGQPQLLNEPWTAFQSRATGLSPDGSIIIGYRETPAGTRAFRWSAASGLTELDVPAEAAMSWAGAAARDGSAIVGGAMLAAGPSAIRWTASGMQILGAPEGALQCAATAVSSDGSVMVGFSAHPSDERGLLWTPVLGMADLNSYLPTLGIDLTGWVLTGATGISGDGRVIVGYGIHNGVLEAWRATIPAYCYANCDASTMDPVLSVQDFACFINRMASGDSYANCDGSTIAPTLNIQDFACFLNRFAAGCP